MEFNWVRTHSLGALYFHDDELTTSVVLFVQGPPALYRWHAHAKTVCFFDLVASTDCLLGDLVYQHCSHTAVGGMSDGIWFVGSHRRLPPFTSGIPPRSAT